MLLSTAGVDEGPASYNLPGFIVLMRYGGRGDLGVLSMYLYSLCNDTTL